MTPSSPPPQSQEPLVAPVFACRRRAAPPGSARIDLFAHCPASLPRLLGLLGLEHALESDAPSRFARPGSGAPRDAALLRLGPRRAAL